MAWKPLLVGVGAAAALVLSQPPRTMAALPGSLVAAIAYGCGAGLDLEGRAATIAMAGIAFADWIVTTAFLGMVIAGLRSRMAARRTRHGTAAATLACALTLGAAGCLTDTPPKTPNQRDAERNAPVVAVPAPPDAGRTPRPAPQ